MGADPNPMADPTPPAATAPPSARAAEEPARPAPGFEHYESVGFLTPEETAGAVGGLARAALRLGDLELGLRAAAVAADAAVGLECAGILERQGRLEVTFCNPTSCQYNLQSTIQAWLELPLLFVGQPRIVMLSVPGRKLRRAQSALWSSQSPCALLNFQVPSELVAQNLHGSILIALKGANSVAMALQAAAELCLAAGDSGSAAELLLRAGTLDRAAPLVAAADSLPLHAAFAQACEGVPPQ